MPLPFRWTLRRHLAVELREWEAENAELRTQRMRWDHHAIATLSSRLGFFASQMLLAFGLLYALALVAIVTDGQAVLNASDKVDYFSALWGIQATILGLVYPLVISFVAVLTQRRPGTAALMIYLHDSGAMLAGLSALLLVGVMGLQYIAVPHLAGGTLLAWLALDALWFLFNIWLTLHFLASTLNFIQPDRRRAMIKRYTIAISQRELTRRVMAHVLFQSAVTHDQVTGPAYDGIEREISLSLGQHGFESGAPILIRDFGRRSRMLVDVHYWLLDFAWKRWKAIHVARSSPELETRLHAATPVVYIAVDPLRPISGKRVLCRADHVIAPPSYIALLIRLSMRFGWEPEHARASCDAVLNDIAQDALGALREGDAHAYEVEIDRWRDLYASLIRAASVRLLDGSVGNILEASTGWISALYERWLQSWYLMVDHAAKRLPERQDYLSELMPVPRQLLRDTRGHVTERMQQRFIGLPRDLWGQLVASRARHHAANAESVAGALTASLSPGSEHELYQRMLYEFVGDWETFLRDIAPRQAVNEDPAARRAAARLQAEHLAQTVVMLFDSADRADRPGAEWMADVLLKWWDAADRAWADGPGHARHGEGSLVTLDSVVDPPRAGPQTQGEWSLAVRHAWSDASLFAIASLAAWSKDALGAAPLMREMSAALLTGKPLRPGGSRLQGPPVTSLEQVMTSWCRQYLTGAEYEHRLERLAEDIRNKRRPPMVAGRIYSSYGRDTADYEAGLVLVMMVLTREVQGVLASVSRCHDQLGHTRDAQVPALLYRLRQWLAQLQDAKWLEWEPVHEGMRSLIPGTHPFVDARARLERDLQAAIEELERRRAAELARRPLSRRALDNIAEEAAASAFDAATAASPLPLFRLSIVDAGLEGAKTFTVKHRYDRASLVEPPMADRYGGASEMFASLLRQHVAGFVAGQAWPALAAVAVETPTAPAYWAQIRKFESWALKNELRPLLFVANATRPQWMWDLAHHVAERVPENIRIDRDPQLRLEGYAWHVNSLPVVRAPLTADTTLLATQESLKDVTFERFPSGRLIECDAEDNPDDPSEVVLVLRWRMRVSVEPNRARWLNHPETPEEA